MDIGKGYRSCMAEEGKDCEKMANYYNYLNEVDVIGGWAHTEAKQVVNRKYMNCVELKLKEFEQQAKEVTDLYEGQE